jgi:transcriptional regulator with GAF, ATPase, and Fis domain
VEAYEFNRQLAEAARSMSGEAGTTATLERAVQMATDMIERCDFAGISVLHEDKLETPAASHEILRKIDELQYELGEGPCLDALKQVDVLTVSNLAEDERWPRWGPHIAGELGIHSSMSFRLFTTGDDLGALNLYATSVDAFHHEDLLDGLILAAHAAVALSASQGEEQFQIALQSSRMIGEAIGIVRERFGLTSEQAFGVLRRMSSQHNIKLNQIALALVETGALPDTRR